jgi:predicted metal-dependent enzyme (double-stranded beta helix superfamily)
MAKKPRVVLAPGELLALLQASEQRETLLRHENALLRQRLLLHEPDDVVRRLVHEPDPDGGVGSLVLNDDGRSVVYRS